MKKHILTSLLLIIAIAASFSSNAQKIPQLLSPKAFEKSIKADVNAVIIDLRTDEEFNEGILKDAVQINFYDEGFEQSINVLDKSKNYYVYCKSGGRSAKAATKMAEMGFNVFDMKGGITAWKSKGKSTVKKEMTF